MNIVIRPFKFTDVTEDYFDWMNDREVTRFLGAAGKSQSMTSLYSYVSKVLTDIDTLFYAVEADGRHVGNLKLVIQREHGKGIISIMIGDRSLWGKGVASEAVRQAVELAFNVLGLRKLEAGMLQPNIGSFRVFQKNGFAVDGVHLRDRYLEGVGYVDAVYMSRFQEDWVHKG